MPSLAMAHGNGLSDTFPHLGKGCTTAYYFDEDCDGYGVGEGYVLGPDPDDSDGTVTTTASVYSKYSTGGTNLDAVANYFTTVKKYTGVLRYIFLATTGNDSTCAGHTNINTAATTPCQTIQKVRDLHLAGDMVIIRGGTYTGYDPDWQYGAHGTASHPVYIVNYPGETVINENVNGQFYVSRDYHTIDGIILQGPASSLGRGFSFGGTNHVTIRNCEARRMANGVFSMQNIRNHLIEHNVFHNMDANPDGTHIIYLGSREQPNSDIIVRSNIFYNGNYPGIQHNGRVTNLLIEKNVFHSLRMGSISILMGGTNITIRNNVFFNGKDMVIVYWYGGASDTPGGPSIGILPYPITNLIIENNSYYKGNYDYRGDPNNWGVISMGDGIGYTNVAAWQPNHFYTQDQYTGYVHPTVRNGWIYAAITTGNSGGTEPIWPTTAFQTVEDGQVRWLAYANNGVTTPSMSGLQIRNNIISMTGWSGSQGRYDQIFKFAPNWMLDISTIENNLFYRQNDSVSQARVLLMPDHTTFKTFTEFQAFKTSWRNNVWGNPLSNSVSSSYWNTPGSYDLRTSTRSPAKGIGVAKNAPTDDITGTVRVGYDAGAYQIGSKKINLPYTTTKIKDKGVDNGKIVIHIVASGYDSSHQTDANRQSTKHINNLFATNFFNDYQSNFNVYKTLVQSRSNGTKLAFSDLQVIANAVPYDYLLIVHNFGASGAQQYTSEAPGGWYNNVYEFYLDDQDYVAPHEMAHLLSYYGSPLVSIGDEYTSAPNAPLCLGMSKSVFNSHDRASNEKWSDLVNTAPFEGSRYCEKGLWRPRSGCVMQDTLTLYDFCPVDYKALQLSVGKHVKIGTIESTPPSLTVTGITRDRTYSGKVTVGATVSDASGIERCEFYFGKYDGVHWTGGYKQNSVKIARTAPYSWDMNTNNYSNGKYAVDVFVYDTNWNVTRRMVWFTIDNSTANLPPASPKNLKKAN